MKLHEVRLEVLKLANMHGREPEHVIERARAYEAYVVQPPRAEAGNPKKAG